jgi:hypothetical protein
MTKECALIDGVIYCQCGDQSSHYGTMGKRGAREVRCEAPPQRSSKEQVYREALEKIAYPNRGVRPQDKEPFLKGFVPLDRRVAIEALKQADALVSDSAELRAVREWVNAGSACELAQPSKERLECDGLVVTDKGRYVDISFEDQSIAIGTLQETALRQWLNARTAHGSAMRSDHQTLAAFYNVTTLDALVDAQARHIERLQAKLQRDEPSYSGRTPREG